MARKPKLGVCKFSPRGGWQLRLLELEDELPKLAGQVEITEGGRGFGRFGPRWRRRYPD